MNSWMHTLRRLLAVGLAVAGAAVLVPAAATPAKDDVVSWTTPTPADGAVLGVAAKTTLSFRLAATSDGSGGTLEIRDSDGSPQGAVLGHTDGNPASATYTWKPPVSQVGVHRVTFTVSSAAGNATAHDRDPGRPREQAAARAVRIRQASIRSRRRSAPGALKRTAGRSFATAPLPAPARRSSARAITPITFRTPELYRNAIQVLDQVKYKGGKTWVRIRLAVLPNGTTGWVPRGSLWPRSRRCTREW